jgi:hypothetical protein
MNPRLLTAVNRAVYRQFPELNGTRPKVRRQGSDAARHFLFVYQTQVALADGHSLVRTVRVVVDDAGQILKITTSH